MVTGFGALAVVVALTAGCTAAAKEPVGLTASPTATAAPRPTPTPSPTPTPTSGVVVEKSDSTLGIVFEAAPDVSGDAADVYNWMATYEKEVWRTLTTNTVSPALSIMASAEVQATMQQMATSNASDQAKVGGVFRARITDISVDGDTAHAKTCDDYREATFADAKGTYTPKEAGFGEARLSDFTLVRVAGESRWKIQSQAWTGTC
jgi:hypothetical protein